MTDILAAGVTSVGLAACAGLRAFLPVLGIGGAARFLGWPLPSGMEALASDTALLIFGLATLVEVAADKIPGVDHILDAMHTVVGPVVGILVAYVPLSHLPLPYALALAIMVGAPVAGGVHALAATGRLKSSAMTAGFGNPVLSAIEDALAIGTLIITIVVPVLGLLVFAGGALWIWRRRRARTVR